MAVHCTQPLAPPDDLAAVALGVAEERGLHRIVVGGGLGLEGDAAMLKLEPLGRHVVDPERHVADPALIDGCFRCRPADDLQCHALIIDQEVPGRIAAALERDRHAQGIDIEIFQSGRIRGINREVFETCHSDRDPLRGTKNQPLAPRIPS